MTETKPPSSPENVDALRDQIAERIWRAEYRRATGKERSIEWAEVGHREVVQYLYVADAIIQLPSIGIRAQRMPDRDALKRIAAFNITPDKATSVAFLMRDIAKDALSALTRPTCG